MRIKHAMGLATIACGLLITGPSFSTVRVITATAGTPDLLTDNLNWQNSYQSIINLSGTSRFWSVPLTTLDRANGINHSVTAAFGTTGTFTCSSTGKVVVLASDGTFVSQTSPVTRNALGTSTLVSTLFVPAQATMGAWFQLCSTAQASGQVSVVKWDE